MWNNFAKQRQQVEKALPALRKPMLSNEYKWIGRGKPYYPLLQYFPEAWRHRQLQAPSAGPPLWTEMTSTFQWEKLIGVLKCPLKLPSNCAASVSSRGLIKARCAQLTPQLWFIKGTSSLLLNGPDNCTLDSGSFLKTGFSGVSPKCPEYAPFRGLSQFAERWSS